MGQTCSTSIGKGRWGGAKGLTWPRPPPCSSSMHRPPFSLRAGNSQTPPLDPCRESHAPVSLQSRVMCGEPLGEPLGTAYQGIGRTRAMGCGMPGIPMQRGDLKTVGVLDPDRNSHAWVPYATQSPEGAWEQSAKGSGK